MKNVTLIIMVIVSLFCQAANAWTDPVPVQGVNSSWDDESPFLSFDGKTLYFSKPYASSTGYHSIWTATRENTSGPFTSVTEVLRTTGHVRAPWVSSDNLRMYYHNETSNWTLKCSTRASINDAWSAGTTISELSSIGPALQPSLTDNELAIVFNIYSAGTFSLWTATRSSIASPFGNARSLSEINSNGTESSPSISSDGLTIYYTSMIGGTSQIFSATRNSLNDLFGNVQHLSIFDPPAGEMSGYPEISRDGTELYFAQGLLGAFDIYVSSIPEPVTALLIAAGFLFIRKR